MASFKGIFEHLAACLVELMMAASKTHPIVCVFDDQQHRTVHVHQTSVQGLQAGPMFHSAVGQSPGVTLHAGWQATGELRGEWGHNRRCF